MISGSCDQNDAGKGDFQELDQIKAVKPFSKFSVKARDIREIPSCVVRVINWAVSGRPGGCFLDLPSDVLHQTGGGNPRPRSWLVLLLSWMWKV